MAGVPPQFQKKGSGQPAPEGANPEVEACVAALVKRGVPKDEALQTCKVKLGKASAAEATAHHRKYHKN